MQFICTNCCLDSTSTAPSEEVSWRQRTGEHMIHLWNATDPRHHHRAWVNLIYLLGLHGGCKCCLPAPTKAHATAGQSRSAMQVSAYLSNITACSLILKILEKILEMSEMTTPTPQCLWFFFFFLSQLWLPRYAPAGVSQTWPPVRGEHIMSDCKTVQVLSQSNEFGSQISFD